MDVDDLFRARRARTSRNSRPFSTAYESFLMCTEACRAVTEGSVDSQYSVLLARSSVITAVTAVEVYFRDMLDAIFKSCKPEFIETRLKHIHSEKYGIDELVTAYKHQIHPLELVVRAQSFQNAEAIDRVFSKFLEKGLFSSIKELEIRLADKPESTAKWSGSELGSLKSLFALRHELVHDPAGEFRVTEVHLKMLGDVIFLIFGADLVLSDMINKNIDPELGPELRTSKESDRTH